jgi:ABC-type cobalt transport system substrate-binding protein
MYSKRVMRIVAVVAAVLLVPLIAMQFTTEVDWNGFDFLVMGVLLFGTGLLIDWVWHRVKKFEYRLMLVGLIAIGLFLIWAELAVGIFGSPFAGS